jgi:hypothetical protein
MIGEQRLEWVMAYRKSGRVATKKDRLSFSRPLRFESSPLLLDDIRNALPKRLIHHFEKQTNIEIAPLSPKVAEAVIAHIEQNKPEAANHINQLREELTGRGSTYRGHAAQIISHEKDAISLALKVGGFSEYDLPSWNQAGDSAPFLLGYESYVLREDPMVIHDSQVFGDWSKIQQYAVGAAEFQREGHKLTIMNVNRHKIEETLGVDLLLYHHTYRSYVLVQYKRMTKDGDKLVYRPTDKSYKSELARMDSFELAVRTDLSPEDYRLSEEFFYFKLCPADLKDPMSMKMIPGMYIPLSLWKLLLDSGSTLGEKGGRIVGYDNVGRYINNTLFVDLVQSGWVGSQIEDTKKITSQIQAAISGDRSLMLATYEQAPKNQTVSID